MKTHFIKMFNYNEFANRQILDAIEAAGSPAVAVKLMAHLLNAEHIWLERCKGTPPYLHALWPDDATVNECREQISSYHTNWITYLTNLPDEDFNNIIQYKRMNGDSFENQLSDICAHVINHGTHTRAQIGQQLKFAGAPTLPVTDYSYYLRQLNN